MKNLLIGLLLLATLSGDACAWNKHGQSSSAPGTISDLTTPTATGTSFTATFTPPSGDITSYEYRINGGTATALGGGSGTAITNQVTGLAVNVEVRALNGATPGPWSNVSTGDPGITLSCVFDNNTVDGNGENPGSWSLQPANVSTTSGPKSWPDMGFGTQGELDAATANMKQFCANVRYFINSTAKVNIYFGMGRHRSAINIANFIWVKNTAGVCSCVATNIVSPVSQEQATITYAVYRSLVALLPWAEQRALFPDPGTFPGGGGVGGISLWTRALIEQTDWNATGAQYWITFAVNSFSFDWDLNPEVNNAQQKGSWIAWHELQQSAAFEATIAWNNWLIFKANGQNWANGDPESPKYASVNNGATSLSNVASTASEPFDLIASQTGMPSARQNGNPGNGNTGMPTGTPMTAPAGSFPKLPFRLTQDAPQWFMIWPASPWLKAAAGF